MSLQGLMGRQGALVLHRLVPKTSPQITLRDPAIPPPRLSHHLRVGRTLIAMSRRCPDQVGEHPDIHTITLDSKVTRRRPPARSPTGSRAPRNDSAMPNRNADNRKKPATPFYIYDPHHRRKILRASYEWNWRGVRLRNRRCHFPGAVAQERQHRRDQENRRHDQGSEHEVALVDLACRVRRESSCRDPSASLRSSAGAKRSARSVPCSRGRRAVYLVESEVLRLCGRYDVTYVHPHEHRHSRPRRRRASCATPPIRRFFAAPYDPHSPATHPPARRLFGRGVIDHQLSHRAATRAATAGPPRSHRRSPPARCSSQPDVSRGSAHALVNFRQSVPSLR